jgi:hypothetical protein
MNKVVHIKVFYVSHVVGRVIQIDRATPWGNPFIIGADGNRGGVCDLHKYWLERWILNKHEEVHKIGIREYSNKWVMEHIKELKGKDLACWCAPKQCHGDTLIILANKE